MRRTLAVLVLVLAAALGTPVAASAGPCQPESCPPPCPFAGIRYAELLCPRPV